MPQNDARETGAGKRMIIYEYPFSERIRTLLRLEDLFAKADHFLEQSGAYEHHAALLALFEIIDVSGRADLKLDLIQELERQRQALLGFRNNPAISEDALSSVLAELEQASTALLAMPGKLGQHLRDNDWLMAIKSRSSIPGGMCEFDLPSYHYWLHLPPEVRSEELLGWFYPFQPLRQGVEVVLRLLRGSSGKPEHHLAPGGAFQRMMSGIVSQQMVRVMLDPQTPFIPEISANRYALNIRFTQLGLSGQRSRQCGSDVEVPFDLVFCIL